MAVLTCWKCKQTIEATYKSCPHCEGSTRLRIGPYVVEKELGHGAFGTVYKAVNPDLGDHVQVAIKLMHSPFSNTAEIRKELQLLSLLPKDNPNLVHVYQDSNINYIVMDFIAGQNLLKRVRDDRALVMENFPKIFKGICNGLVGLHNASLIHRDLKPANILLTDNWVAKIVDMGLATMARSGVGSKAGSMEVAAPEVIGFKEGDDGYNKTVDLWALGVITYFIWTGHFPFGTDLLGDEDYRDPGEISRAIAALSYVRPEKLNKDIPANIVELIEALLSKRGSRFPSAETVVDWFSATPYVPTKAPDTYLLGDYQRQLAAIYGKKNAGQHPALILDRALATFGFPAKAAMKMSGKEQTEALVKYLPRTFAWLVSLVGAAGWRIDNVIYYKYPNVCPYCNAKPCSQHHPVTNETINLNLLDKVLHQRTPAPENWTFSRYAQMFQEIYGTANANRSLGEIVLHLYSELSELSHVLRRANLTRSRARTAIMSLELADVFAWFFALYNAVSKDEPWFEKVFWAQFSTCQWCHKLPCTCPDVLGEIEIITNWRLSRATLEALDVAGTAKEV